ncbi:MAG: chemotaxis protein CheA [Myxococcota bacterium]
MEPTAEAPAFLERARDALRSSGDRARACEALRAISLSGRLGEIVAEALGLLDGGAAPEIDPGTVDAIVAIALEGVVHGIDDPVDDEIDAHLQALRALAPIPGFDLGELGEPLDAPAEADPEPSGPEIGASMFERPSPELVSAFQIEARELLANCERGMLELEADQSATAPVHEVFRALHSFKGNCGFLGFGEMEEVAHRAESLLVLVKEGRRRCDTTVTAALLGTLDALGRAVETAADGGAVPGRVALLGILDKCMQQPTGDAPPAPEVPVPVAAITEVRPQRPQATLRVDVLKVDQLLDLVGELIIATTAVRHLPSAEEPDAHTRASAQLDRVVRSLQDVAMSLRMVPIGPTFQRMVRVVRDVSQRVGKPVELQLSGDETEIDKTVAELLADPLVHLVRNALDHGLEPPEEREARGKPRTGRLRLTGSHVGGEVWVRIEDDGRGLSRDKIGARAVERGLVSREALARMSDTDVFGFIFEPGFSTAEQVSDVSGRGVGMDVVRRNLERVRGRIDIKSDPGRGAAFTLRIPLTLAIIEGMLVRIGDTSLTVPLLCIRESVVVRPEDVTVLTTWQELVRIRGELIPVLRLHRLYGIQSDYTALHEGILVVVEDGGRPLCLFVDQLIGQRQTVIKPISGFLGNVRGIAGCTVLGDGRISLILDVPSLVHLQAD